MNERIYSADYFFDGMVLRFNGMSRDEWSSQPYQWRLRHPQRTKWTHPYAFDSFIVWEKSKVEGKGLQYGSAYHDRMIMWGSDNYYKCLKKVWPEPERLDFKDSKRVEKFLRLYFKDRKLALIRIIEECNVSNGYSVFCFIWKSGKRKVKAGKKPVAEESKDGKLT